MLGRPSSEGNAARVRDGRRAAGKAAGRGTSVAAWPRRREGPDRWRRTSPRVVAYDVDLGGPGVHRGLPSTTLTFVLPVGEPLDVGWRGVDGSRARRWSTVSGLHARPAEIHHDGHQAGVQLALTTAGARALFGVPAAALAGELLEVEDVAPWLRDLPERLHETAPERSGGAGRARAGRRARPARRARAAGRGRPGAGPAHPRCRGAGGRRRGRLQPPAPRRPGARRVRAGAQGGAAAGPVRGVARAARAGAAGRGRPPVRVRRPGPPDPGVGRRWPAARRRPGCARSSHSSKTSATRTGAG